MNTLSWRTPTTPLPMEINPRKVFERLFGTAAAPEERAARSRKTRSILDAIMQEATGLQRNLGAHDRATVSDYLESVREIERRIQKLGHAAGRRHLTLPEDPVGIPVVISTSTST